MREAARQTVGHRVWGLVGYFPTGEPNPDQRVVAVRFELAEFRKQDLERVLLVAVQQEVAETRLLVTTETVQPVVYLGGSDAVELPLLFAWRGMLIILPDYRKVLGREGEMEAWQLRFEVATGMRALV